jgi:polyisoprenoid-binding protein YceI
MAGRHRIHSSVGFAVDYVAGAFHGTFSEFDAALSDGVLSGSAKVASVHVQDENLAGHLQSPDFFDAERHPELTFTSSSINCAGDRVTIDGDLTIKGHTKAVELTGEISESDRRPLRRRALRADARDRDRPRHVRRQLEQPAAQRRAGPLERGEAQGRAAAVKAA